MEEELNISVEHHDHSLILRLIGDITKISGETLLKYHTWEKGLPNNEKILIINFNRVNYINSAGIAYLIRVSKLLFEQGIEIRAFGLEYHYEKMFHIVGLNKFIKFYPSEWAAMEEL